MALPAVDLDAALPAAGDALIARLEAVPFSPWHRRARLIVGSATFFDAFDALAIAFVLPVLRPLWGLSDGEIGWLIAASYIGQVVGALVFSRLAESFGRIPCAAAAVALMSLMSFFCALSGDVWSLFLCRLVQGIGVGGEMPVAAAYIGELSRAEGRGRYFLLYEMIFPLGLMAAGQAGRWLVPALGWQVMFLLGGVPGLIIALLLLRLPELHARARHRPRHLLAARRLGGSLAAGGRDPRPWPRSCAGLPDVRRRERRGRGRRPRHDRDAPSPARGDCAITRDPS